MAKGWLVSAAAAVGLRTAGVGGGDGNAGASASEGAGAGDEDARQLEAGGTGQVTMAAVLAMGRCASVEGIGTASGQWFNRMRCTPTPATAWTICI